MSCNYFVYKTADNTDKQPPRLYTFSQSMPNDTTQEINHFKPEENQLILLPLNNFPYHIKNGLFESKLIDWSKQFCSKDKITLDIGAHTGTYTVKLAPYSKQIIAFEPQKTTYNALCGTIALSSLSDKVDCYRVALGSYEQQQTTPIITLNIISVDGGGSTLIPPNEKGNYEHTILRTEQVELKTLDSFKFSDPIGFIKMDVEENECNVLKGAVETLKASNYPNILFECNHPTNQIQQDNKLTLFNYITGVLPYHIVKIGGVNNMFLAVKREDS